MKLHISSLIHIFSLLLILLLVIGCSDANYDAGVYWMKKENNPIMAARSFQRSLEKHPGRWKTHRATIEALSLAEDEPGLIKQLNSTLLRWPDSCRAESVYQPGIALLGEKRYNRISAPIRQHHLGRKLAKKGNKPEILCDIIMASCRMNDTTSSMDYFKKLLNVVDNINVPDSVIQELGFLIGPAGIDWIRLEWKVNRNPEDIEARLAQIDAGLVVGDSAATRSKLTELVKRIPDSAVDSDVAKRLGRLVGADPLTSKQLIKGWDGSYSPDGKYIIYLKDLGRKGESDPYIYRASAKGGAEIPLMKGLQQFLPSIAWPCYSPDGRWIYFYGSPNKNWSPTHNIGRFHLYRVKPAYGAKPRKLTNADLLLVYPYFTRNNKVLLIRRDIGSTRASVEIVRLNPEKRILEVVSRIGEPVSGATFMADGDSLIFTTNRGIFRRSVRGGRMTVDLTWCGLNFPVLSPDNSRLLVYNRRGQALIIDRNSRKLMFIGSTAVPSGAFGRHGELLITENIKGQNRLVKLDLDSKVSSTDRFIAALKQ